MLKECGAWRHLFHVDGVPLGVHATQCLDGHVVGSSHDQGVKVGMRVKLMDLDLVSSVASTVEIVHHVAILDVGVIDDHILVIVKRQLEPAPTAIVSRSKFAGVKEVSTVPLKEMVGRAVDVGGTVPLSPVGLSRARKATH